MELEKKDNRSEIINSIENYINDDVEKLLEGKPLNMGALKPSVFDEFGVYQNVLEEINEKERYRIKKNNTYSLIRWISACVITLIFLNIGYYYYQDSKDIEMVYQEVQTTRGEKLLVLLPDGSRVWLNADSKLTYPEQFAKKNRNVTLEGEAYFEVKKNTASLFSVFTGDVRINVTGTSFNVSAYTSDQEVKTTLDEGAISIGYSNSKIPMLAVEPGQTAVFKKDNKTISIEDNEHYRNDSYWKENKLVFRNSSLGDVLKVLSRHFDVEFKIKDSKITHFTYNFISKGNDLNNILETMESITPIKFKKVGEYNYTVQ